MNSIVFINGSPREKGNTNILLQTLMDSANKILPHSKIKFIDAAKISVNPCLNCDYCKRNAGRCIRNDDATELLDTIAAADTLIFGTPVYWWGITAQIKAFIDRFYAKSDELGKSRKKLGLIVTGAAELSDPQYQLIKGQFDCICDYLHWDFIFFKEVSASEAGEVSNRKQLLEEISALAEKLS